MLLKARRYTKLKVPVNFVPRDYQMPVWKSMVIDQSHKRAALVWPRRAGKDLTAINIMAYHALVVRPGNYYYFAPTYSQGEKIIWDGKMFNGEPFLSCFPGYPYTRRENPQSVIERIDRRKMKIHLTNGSMFQVVGASEEDNVVGTNPVGCVFSEYSIQSPKFWYHISPILAENGGWAVFTYTIRGFNHGWQLYQTNKNNPNWIAELRTCETTLHDGERVISDEIIQEEIASGSITPELARQEYYNDPYASTVGAYYGEQMRRLLDQGRIGKVPWDPAYPVHTAWDIGHRDATAIWFFQVDYSGNVNIIDTYSSSGAAVTHYIKHLKEKPYTYGTHFGPHDLKNANFQTGKTTLEIALQHGFRFTVVPQIGIQEGIDAGRALLPRCQFDSEKCFEGLDALRQYCKEESGIFDNNNRPIFRDKPKHDWTSHYADGFRYLAVAIDKVLGYNGYVDGNGVTVDLPDKGITDYDIFGI